MRRAATVMVAPELCTKSVSKATRQLSRDARFTRRRKCAEPFLALCYTQSAFKLEGFLARLSVTDVFIFEYIVIRGVSMHQQTPRSYVRCICVGMKKRLGA